jgi:hypothetical protein
MDSLSPETRALLAASRRAESAPGRSRDRVWQRVTGSVALGAALTSSTAAATAGLAGKAVGTAVVAPTTALVTKWLLLGFAVGIVATGSVIGVQEATRSLEPSASPPAMTHVASPATPPPPPASPSPPPPGDASSAASMVRVPRRPPPAPSSLAEEATHIEAARRALHDGDPARALAELERRTVRHSDGALEEEAQATRVLALCAGGRVAEAHTAAETFTRRFPRSPLLDRVRSACR